MYKEFYGFKELPFNVIPDPRFLYRSHSHRDALAYITYGIFQKKGFIAVTGEVGVGKTTVVNAFIDLFHQSLAIAFVFSTKFPFEQLLYLICRDFDLNVEGMNKAQMLLALNDFLIEQYEQNRNTLLVIDEAHNLSIEVLEELRMLSNLETRDRKLLQAADPGDLQDRAFEQRGGGRIYQVPLACGGRTQRGRPFHRRRIR
jgi:general secretion pathway protein A